MGGRRIAGIRWGRGGRDPVCGGTQRAGSSRSRDVRRWDHGPARRGRRCSAHGGLRPSRRNRRALGAPRSSCVATRRRAGAGRSQGRRGAARLGRSGPRSRRRGRPRAPAGAARDGRAPCRRRRDGGSPRRRSRSAASAPSSATSPRPRRCPNARSTSRSCKASTVQKRSSTKCTSAMPKRPRGSMPRGGCSPRSRVWSAQPFVSCVRDALRVRRAPQRDDAFDRRRRCPFVR